LKYLGSTVSLKSVTFFIMKEVPSSFQDIMSFRDSSDNISNVLERNEVGCVPRAFRLFIMFTIEYIIMYILYHLYPGFISYTSFIEYTL
jgi:hypothetical protein